LKGIITHKSIQGVFSLPWLQKSLVFKRSRW